MPSSWKEPRCYSTGTLEWFFCLLQACVGSIDSVLIFLVINIRAKREFHLITECISKIDRTEIESAIQHLEKLDSRSPIKKTKSVKPSPRLRQELKKQLKDMIPAPVYQPKSKITLPNMKKLPFAYLSQKYLVNLPPQNLFFFILVPMAMFMLLNFPSLIDFFYLRNIHNELEDTFQSSISVNIASSSTIMMNAMNYLHYYHSYSTNDTIFDSKHDLEVIRSLQKVVSDAKNIPAQGYFQDRLSRHVCEGLDYFAPDLPLDSNQTETCLYSTFDIPDMNYVMALNKLLTNAIVIDRQLTENTELSITKYFRQSEFIKHDLLAVYTTLTLQRYSEVSLDRILKDTKSSSNGTDISTFGLSACLLFFCWLFKYHYIHRRLSLQHKATMSIAVLNDRLLDCSYIKRHYSKFYLSYY